MYAKITHTIGELSFWVIGIQYEQAKKTRQNPFIFEQFVHEQKSPLFKKGILFTALAVSKGVLMKAFFEKIGWAPKKVIMLDDKRENLESLHSELKKLGIEFVGFEYHAADALPAQFDKEIAESQMKHLIAYRQWLPASRFAVKSNKVTASKASLGAV